MKTHATIVASLCVLAAAGIVRAAEPSAREQASRKDREVYNRLIQEIRNAYVKLGRAYDRAVAEARENGGQARTKSRAEIVSLRDEIDRKSVRLMLVADRHGWDLPTFNLDDFRGSKSEERSADLTDRFFPPDPLITQGLADEARRKAARVRLPVIPAAPELPED